MAEARQANLIHFSTSPPGQPLMHHAAARALDALPSSITRPASLALRPFQCSDANIMSYTRGEILSVGLVGMLMPLWAALAALPVYAAGRLLTDDPLAALRAAIWWPLVPSVLLFAPTWNTLYPLLGVTAFALLLAGLRREREPARAMRCLAAGVVMAAADAAQFRRAAAAAAAGVVHAGVSGVFIDGHARSAVAGPRGSVVRPGPGESLGGVVAGGGEFPLRPAGGDV
jgi:hypothetical protein